MGVPYHILRCVLTQLGAMKKQETILRIYPVTVDCTDWQKKVTRKILQGGTFTKTRLDIWAEEMDRIERYTLKGDCVPLSAMIDFFKKQGAS